MNKYNLMKAISEQPEDLIARKLLDPAQDTDVLRNAELSEFKAVDAETEKPRTFRWANRVMFAASMAAAVMLVGGFAYMIHAIGNKPETVRPGASITDETEQATGEESTEATAAETTENGADTAETTSVTTTASEDGTKSGECPVVPAENVMNCKTLNLPSEINGRNIYVFDLIDGETVLVSLHCDADGSIGNEMGTVSLKDGSYRRLTELPDGMSIAACSDRYAVMEQTVPHPDDWAKNRVTGYCLYDLRTGTLSEPFWTTAADDDYYGTYPRPVLDGDTVYFEDCSSAGTGINVYDIAAGRITATYPDFHVPTLYQGELLGFDSSYEKLVSVKDNGASLSVECAYQSIYRYPVGAADGIYMLEDDALKNLTTGETLVTFDSYADMPAVSDSAAVWANGICQNTAKPMVYDIAGKRLLSLENITDLSDVPEFYGYTKGGVTLVHVLSEGHLNDKYIVLTANS